MLANKYVFSDDGYFTEHTRDLFHEKLRRTGENWLLVSQTFGFDYYKNPSCMKRWFGIVRGQIPAPILVRRLFALWLSDEWSIPAG